MTHQLTNLQSQLEAAAIVVAELGARGVLVLSVRADNLAECAVVHVADPGDALDALPGVSASINTAPGAWYRRAVHWRGVDVFWLIARPVSGQVEALRARFQ